MGGPGWGDTLCSIRNLCRAAEGPLVWGASLFGGVLRGKRGAFLAPLVQEGAAPSLHSVGWRGGHSGAAWLGVTGRGDSRGTSLLGRKGGIPILAWASSRPQDPHPHTGVLSPCFGWNRGSPEDLGEREGMRALAALIPPAPRVFPPPNPCSVSGCPAAGASWPPLRPRYSRYYFGKSRRHRSS